ncbi:hypothetical protein [Bosea sp. (in: a-proteobacteria)]|uniref:hypothetical protein n=1 Tax=Bosea sp. (in: a-proteobacteria) TaxID=1871050 RepID=UPI002734A6AC|nr:hypothetical protein [Bosea sp. (in: a-proteobacteria)]MDP3410465.1 hypothetical protein [Bosea sp. (in: a-proteobacteria)]
MHGSLGATRKGEARAWSALGGWLFDAAGGAATFDLAALLLASSIFTGAASREKEHVR